MVSDTEVFFGGVSIRAASRVRAQSKGRAQPVGNEKLNLPCEDSERAWHDRIGTVPYALVLGSRGQVYRFWAPCCRMGPPFRHHSSASPLWGGARLITGVSSASEGIAPEIYLCRRISVWLAGRPCFLDFLFRTRMVSTLPTL